MIAYRNTITAEEYNDLRGSVGWTPVEAAQAAAGLAGTADLVVAVEDSRPVGMTRSVSDGGYVVIVVDVIVRPEYQGKGIGKALMNRLLSPIRSSLAPGQRVMVNLMSMEGKEPFYRSLGFQERPHEGRGAGMVQWIEGPKPDHREGG